MSSSDTPKSTLLCDPSDKRRLEIENRATVIRYITGFFDPAFEGRKPYQLSLIRELHALTIERIYPCAGKTRNATGKVKIEGATFSPRAPYLVENDLSALLDKARGWEAGWTVQRRTEHAADCFHEFNHIHPFRGGNGRVGRAFLHLMLYDMAVLQPPEQIFDYIFYRRSDYLAALQSADGGNYQPIRGFIFRGVVDLNARAIFALVSSGRLGRYVLPRLKPELRRFVKDDRHRVLMSDRTYARCTASLVKEVERIAERMERATG